MDNSARIYIYAFLSRIFEKEVDEQLLKDLKSDESIMEMIGEDTKEWFSKKSDKELLEELNIDFSSLFLMNSPPIESSVLDDKDEVLVGLQNPVMQFYFNYGYELNLQNSKLQTPDHISIELGFMQNLISNNELKTALDFLNKHLLEWSIPYLIGILKSTSTPFYKDICEFTTEFLLADYEYLQKEIGYGD